MDTSLTFSLPKDIVRSVLEACTFQFDVKGVIGPFTISRDVKSWVEPRVYSEVILKTKEQVRLFSSALRDELVSCRPARHVKRLWILCTNHSFELFSGGGLERCVHLVHLPFDGRRMPFPDSVLLQTVNLWPRLTRLSMHSPYWVDNDFHASRPLIPWDRLTHLHFFGHGTHNTTLYDRLFLFGGIDQFTCLESMCIELTYPSPETETVNYTVFAQAALFHILIPARMNLLHGLFTRLPILGLIVIKTDFSCPIFRILWDNLAKSMKDEPRIVFEMKELRDQDLRIRYGIPCGRVRLKAWQRGTC